MKEITVTVAGASASGKSAIAEVIRQALAISGIKVVLNDDNGIGTVDEAPGVIAASLSSRIDTFNERGSSVSISTLQLRHAPTDSARLAALNELTAEAQARGEYD